MGLKKYADNLGIDEEDFRELVHLFIETTRNDIAILNSAVESNDIDKAREAAHSIKGAAGNLGFMDIWESASECERAAMSGSMSEIEERIPEITSLLEKLTGIV